MASCTRCTSLVEFEAVEARFYDDGEAERLIHREIEDYLDDIMAGMERGTSDGAAEAALIAMAPLKVAAYLPELRDPAERAAWVRRSVEALEETISERHYEDLGDPENASPGFTPAERTEVEAFVARWLDRVGVWRCEPVAEYVMTTEDIRTVLGRSK